jgi:Rieske Fe-S protein
MGHDESTDRRSFLAWATLGLGAVFTAIFGAPVIAYLIDPRNRQGAGGAFHAVDGVNLDGLTKDIPTQGALRAVRRDAWTVHPSDVVGRVWIVLKQDRLPDQAVSNDPGVLEVFTTICPHLGCSVNLNPDPATGFTCPCHAAQFTVNGNRTSEHNPAQRGMDTLDWRLEVEGGRKTLLVKYENFKSSIAEKEVV